jgi:hypothetical protein
MISKTLSDYGIELSNEELAVAMESMDLCDRFEAGPRRY